jgi:hypothetical protein
MAPTAAATPKTFISYAREDSEFALKLAAELRQAGANVWVDQLDIPPGAHWDRTVQEALNACPRLLVILSPASVSSENVMDEVSYAIDKGKPVVPVLYRECDIPFRLRRLQQADVRAGVAELLSVLGVKELSGTAQAAPSPPLPRPSPEPQVQTGGAAGNAAYTPPSFAAPPVNPNPPVPTVQFFLGRWRVEGFNGSDLIYLPDGTFYGVMMAPNMAGYSSPMNVFGRWNFQVLGPGMFQVQLWLANGSTWAGTFQVLDWDHIQNLELNYAASRIR